MFDNKEIPYFHQQMKKLEYVNFSLKKKEMKIKICPIESLT